MSDSSLPPCEAELATLVSRRTVIRVLWNSVHSLTAGRFPDVQEITLHFFYYFRIIPGAVDGCTYLFFRRRVTSFGCPYLTAGTGTCCKRTIVVMCILLVLEVFFLVWVVYEAVLHSVLLATAETAAAVWLCRARRQGGGGRGRERQLGLGRAACQRHRPEKHVRRGAADSAESDQAK